MFDQLESIVGRYEELGELLSDPEVVSDTKRFMELSREEADLRDKVATYNEYKKVLETISDSEEMLGEGGLDDDKKCSKKNFHQQNHKKNFWKKKSKFCFCQKTQMMEKILF